MNAYVDAPVLVITKYSYIQINDLLECLESLFEGSLDSFTPNQFWRPLREWHPGNSLKGQLDSTTLYSLLRRLPKVQQAALTLKYIESPQMEQRLLAGYSGGESYDDYVSGQWLEGLGNLADLVHSQI